MQDDNPLPYVTPQADQSLPTIGEVRFRRKLTAVGVVLILGWIYYYCRWRNYWKQPLFSNVYAVEVYQKMPIGIYRWWPWPLEITDGHSHVFITDWRSNMAVLITVVGDKDFGRWGLTPDGLNAAWVYVGSHQFTITRQRDLFISVDLAGTTNVRHLNRGEAEAMYRQLVPSAWPRSLSFEEQTVLENQLAATTRP